MKTFNIKCVTIGNSCVGKTSIIQSFLTNNISDTHDSTIGASFVSKRFRNKEKEEELNLRIWDTAGQERYKSLIPMYLRGSNIAIIVYDITDFDSFDKLDSWVSTLRIYSQTTKIIIVSNKNDLIHLKSRNVSNKKGYEYAKKIGADFFDVSAKSGTNIKELFDHILNIGKVHNEEPKKDVIKIEKDSFNNYSLINAYIIEPSEYVQEKCCVLS